MHNTSFPRHFLTQHEPITGKKRQETCDFVAISSPFEGFRYEYDVTRPIPSTARYEHRRLMADAKLLEIT